MRFGGKGAYWTLKFDGFEECTACVSQARMTIFVNCSIFDKSVDAKEALSSFFSTYLLETALAAQYNEDSALNFLRGEPFGSIEIRKIWNGR